MHKLNQKADMIYSVFYFFFRKYTTSIKLKTSWTTQPHKTALFYIKTNQAIKSNE